MANHHAFISPGLQALHEICIAFRLSRKLPIFFIKLWFILLYWDSILVLLLSNITKVSFPDQLIILYPKLI